MKRWQFAIWMAGFALLVSADRRLESSRRFQNVRHAIEHPRGDLPVFDRVLMSLLA